MRYNGFDGTEPAYGNEITQYEYLLPAGWNLNGTLSTGNWITANNDVSITTDFASGVGGNVQIRALNTECGVTLSKSPIKYLPISRPAPPITIPESDVEICSGSKNYTILGLPTGANTTWSISNNYGIASISNQTNTSVQVNKINSGNGHETLTATVTHCSFTYNITKSLNFGGPTTTFDIFTYLPLYSECFETDAFYIFRTNLVNNYDVYPPNYQWSYRINGTMTETIVSSTGQDGLFIFPISGTYDILVRPVNSCSIGNTPSIKTITVQMSPECGGKGFRLSSYPNPTKNYINVAIDNEKADDAKLSTSEKIIYKLYDLHSATIIKQWVFDNTINKLQLNLNGVKAGNYILLVKKGKYQQTIQIIISK